MKRATPCEKAIERQASFHQTLIISFILLQFLTYKSNVVKHDAGGRKGTLLCCKRIFDHPCQM